MSSVSSHARTVARSQYSHSSQLSPKPDAARGLVVESDPHHPPPPPPGARAIGIFDEYDRLICWVMCTPERAHLLDARAYEFLEVSAPPIQPFTDRHDRQDGQGVTRCSAVLSLLP